MDTALFLGIKVTPLLHKELKMIPEEKRAILINNQGEYLHFHEDLNELYLGKRLTPLHNIKELELIEVHIGSLLNRLLPQFNLHNHQLQLISYVHSS